MRSAKKLRAAECLLIKKKSLLVIAHTGIPEKKQPEAFSAFTAKSFLK
jgi:hypothetical protein